MVASLSLSLERATIIRSVSPWVHFPCTGGQQYWIASLWTCSFRTQGPVLQLLHTHTDGRKYGIIYSSKRYLSYCGTLNASHLVFDCILRCFYKQRVQYISRSICIAVCLSLSRNVQCLPRAAKCLDWSTATCFDIHVCLDHGVRFRSA